MTSPLSATFAGNEARYLEPPEPDYSDVEICGWCNEALSLGAIHPVCSRKIDERSCFNCQVVMVDYQKGDPCEFCGLPLGAGS